MLEPASVAPPVPPSEAVSSRNVAEAERTPVASRVQVGWVPADAQSPPHPRKAEPAAALAVNVTDVPSGNVLAHERPQSIPAGADFTVPAPLPLRLTVMDAGAATHAPFRQELPAAQAFPQLPQLRGSVAVSTQAELPDAVLQARWPAGQVQLPGCPLPLNPELQAQRNAPGVLKHPAFTSHGEGLTAHSSRSWQVTPSPVKPPLQAHV